MTGGPTSRPLVSFVVPCYKHGHFLVECVESILGQTYHDVEVLIMDDCSPDDTPAIAQSFSDPRVRYIRNDVNLGHLRNYNKGIGLATGEYVWLINVDDYLRRRYVLERFVAALERNPTAAFVFCPAVQVHGHDEGVAFGLHGDADRVFTGPEFLERLLVRNCVATPAVMVRKSSYDRMGMFPLDLPYAGDWYQWCRHAFYGHVVYLAEPMVCYRIHELNMTKDYFERPAAVISDEIAVRWRAKQTAERLGLKPVVRAALRGIAHDYGVRVAQRVAGRSKFGLTFGEFEASLAANCDCADERRRITATVFAALGDHYYHQGETAVARQHYRRALRENRADLRTWVKGGLLATGAIGRALRSAATQLPGLITPPLSLKRHS
jgi:glycosyltransferase involved in cell wall biosynthesis